MSLEKQVFALGLHIQSIQTAASERQMNSQASALRDICIWIMRDLELDLSPGQDLLDFAVDRVTDTQKKAAIAQIEEALSSNSSDEKLARLWLGSGAMVGFEDITFYRYLFEELKNRLEGKPARFRF